MVAMYSEGPKHRTEMLGWEGGMVHVLKRGA